MINNDPLENPLPTVNYKTNKSSRMKKKNQPIKGEAKFGTSNPDLSVAIKVFKAPLTTIEKLKLARKYVELKSFENDRVFVKIDKKTRDRLFTNKHELRKAERKGNLNEALFLITKKAENYHSILQNYEKINSDSKITPNLLKKVIQVALEQQKCNLPSQTVTTGFIKNKQIFFTNTSETNKEIKDKQVFLINFNKEKKIVDIALLGKKLGKGFYGEVRVATDLATGNIEAYKRAKPSKFLKNPDALKKSIAQIKNEYAILCFLNKYGKVWGIQAKPTHKVELITPGKVGESGFIGKKYTSNYADYSASELNKLKEGSLEFDQFLRNRLIDFHQFLYALNFMATLETLHNDLKPENIFVSTMLNGQKLVHVGDFGGARNVRETETNHLAPETCTASYVSQVEFSYAHEWASQGKIQECINLSLKMDVLSMGKILYEALTPHSPYGITPKGFINLKSTYNPLPSYIPPTLRKIIDDMLNPNPVLRISAQEAFTRFDYFLRDEYADLHREVQQIRQEAGLEEKLPD